MAEITIDEKELKRLIAEGVADATRTKNTGVIKKKINEHYVKLRSLDGKIIVGTDGSSDRDKDKNGDEIILSTFILKDGDKTSKKKMSWREVLTLPRIEALITKEEKGTVEVEGDPIEVIEYKGDRQIHTGKYTENTVSIPYSKITVKVNGVEFEVDDNVINI
jgi:hypothetical protein